MTTKHLVALEVNKNKILFIDTNTFQSKALVDNLDQTPDGIIFDDQAKKLHWTNMGHPYDANNGYLQSCNLDGSNVNVTVKNGNTHTPKQIQLDSVNKYLYWCDREGMKVLRCNMNDYKVEQLLDTSNMFLSEDVQARHCVGIALDISNNYIYWTQKGPSHGEMGRILRAHLDFSNKNTIILPEKIEVLLDHLPEPIDLEIDYSNNLLYWTDRADNTLSYISIAESEIKHPKRKIIAEGFNETIGLVLDSEKKLIYTCDLSGKIYRVDLENNTKDLVYTSENGAFTGIDLIES